MQDYSSVGKRLKEIAQKMKESGVIFLMCPSPYRGEGAAIEYTDYDTATYYRKWLESGKDLERYAEHQKAGFPLFDGKTRPPKTKNDIGGLKSLEISSCMFEVSKKAESEKAMSMKMKIIKGRG
jgi:hypothetical protein